MAWELCAPFTTLCLPTFDLSTTDETPFSTPAGEGHEGCAAAPTFDAVLEDLDVHVVPQFVLNVGFRSANLVVSLHFDPSDAEVTFLATDRKPEGVLDYRWQRYCGSPQEQALTFYFGDVAGVFYVGAVSSQPLRWLKLTCERRPLTPPLLKKDDMFQPWQVLQHPYLDVHEEACLRLWLDANPKCAPLLDEEGCTPVLRACQCPMKGERRLVALLVENYRAHFYINQRDQTGWGALHYLAHVTEDALYKPTPFMSRATAYQRRCELLQYLLSRPGNVDVNLVEARQQHNTPLHLAAATDAAPPCEAVRLLLRHPRCDVLARNAAARFAVEEACLCKRAQNAAVIADFVAANAGRFSLSVLQEITRKSGLELTDERMLARIASHPPPPTPPPHAATADSRIHTLTVPEAQLRLRFEMLGVDAEGKVSVSDLLQWLLLCGYGATSSEPQESDPVKAVLRKCGLQFQKKFSFAEYLLLMSELAQRVT